MRSRGLMAASFGGMADMAGLAAGFVSVENDPRQTLLRRAAQGVKGVPSERHAAGQVASHDFVGSTEAVV
jgi:hypothetical protein